MMFHPLCNSIYFFLRHVADYLELYGTRLAQRIPDRVGASQALPIVSKIYEKNNIESRNESSYL